MHLDDEKTLKLRLNPQLGNRFVILKSVLQFLNYGVSNSVYIFKHHTRSNIISSVCLFDCIQSVLVPLELNANINRTGGRQLSRSHPFQLISEEITQGCFLWTRAFFEYFANQWQRLILGFSERYPRVSSDVGHRARRRFMFILTLDNNAWLSNDNFDLSIISWLSIW